MPINSGERLGPYEILSPIEAGRTGKVYRVRDARLGPDVAIKVSEEQFSERIEREAQGPSFLESPQHRLYVIEGESPNGPPPLDEVLRIARQIADALEAAHERGSVDGALPRRSSGSSSWDR